jgi:hypothetical protein
VSLCSVVSSKLAPGFKGTIEAAQIESMVDIDTLTSVIQGEHLVENIVRILGGAMSPEERAVMDILSVGKEGEATDLALASLEEDGLIVSQEGGTEIQGALLAGVAAAVAEGSIKIS